MADESLIPPNTDQKEEKKAKKASHVVPKEDPYQKEEKKISHIPNEDHNRKGDKAKHVSHLPVRIAEVAYECDEYGIKAAKHRYDKSKKDPKAGEKNAEGKASHSKSLKMTIVDKGARASYANKKHDRSTQFPSSTDQKVKSDTQLGGKGDKGDKGAKSDTKVGPVKETHSQSLLKGRKTVIGHGHKNAKVSGATPSHHKRIEAELEYVRFPSIMGWYLDGHQFSVESFSLNEYYAVYFNNLQEELDIIAEYENEETFTEKARRNFWPPHWMGFVFRTRGVYMDFDEFLKDPPRTPPEFNFEHEHPTIGIYHREGEGAGDQLGAYDKDKATGKSSKMVTLAEGREGAEAGEEAAAKKDVDKKKTRCISKRKVRKKLMIPQCYAGAGLVPWDHPRYKCSDQRIPLDRPVCPVATFVCPVGPVRPADCNSVFTQT